MAHKNHKKHGLAKGERYAMLPKRVVISDAYLSLPASAMRLLSLALCQYNGSNNGDIAITQSQLKPHGFRSTDTLTRALKRLRATGLLILTRQGGFANGGKRPNLYAFSWLDIPKNPKLEIDTPAKPSDAWAEYRIKRSPGTSIQLNPDSGQSVNPIPTSTTHSNNERTDRTNTVVPDTFLRSSLEARPPGLGVGRGSSVR